MKRRSAHPAFTLLELILVMLIITIMAGVLAPAMVKFTAGRSVDNFGRQIIGVSQFARAQSISEGRVYRLNFDQRAGEFWITADSGGGNFTVPQGDFNQRFVAPDGVTMQVQNGVQPNMSMIVNQNVQQEPTQQPSVLIDGTQTGGTSGQTMQNMHVQGQTYVEFTPLGRVDPVTITLYDKNGHSATIACATPTDRLAMQEATR